MGNHCKSCRMASEEHNESIYCCIWRDRFSTYHKCRLWKPDEMPDVFDTEHAVVNNTYDDKENLTSVEVTGGYKCNKCGGDTVYIKTFKNCDNVGVYCSDCDSYIRFIGEREKKWIFGFTKVAANVNLVKPAKTEQLTLDDLF